MSQLFGCGGSCRNPKAKCKAYNVECKACGKRGHVKKVCSTGRPKGVINLAPETLEGETDNNLANFAVAALTREAQQATVEDASSDKEVRGKLLAQALPGVSDPEAANGASPSAGQDTLHVGDPSCDHGCRLDLVSPHGRAHGERVGGPSLPVHRKSQQQE